IVESPAPLTCQSPGGSPGLVFSHAITLVTGGPHGPAAAAGRASTRGIRLRSTARAKALTERRPIVRREETPVTDISAPTHECHLKFPSPSGAAQEEARGYMTKKTKGLHSPGSPAGGPGAGPAGRPPPPQAGGAPRGPGPVAGTRPEGTQQRRAASQPPLGR